MLTPLVTPATLALAMGASGEPVLLDVRWALGGPPGIEEFRLAHIPNARFVDLDRDLAAPPGAGRHPLPDAAAFGAAMRAAGVSSGRGVVVYDAGNSMAAARAWWLLRYFGHPDVRVLDGGFAAWIAEGRPVTSDVAEAAAGDFEPSPGHMPMLDAAGAAELARTGLLLDARAAERFRGDVEPVDPVAGHIPGARSAPTTENIDTSGRFLDHERLRGRFAALGVAPRVAVGAYCGSGVTAAHEVLALTLAGVESPSLYVGSWSDWIADPSRPIATGEI
ncbi:MAG: sulfurtransferase [Candidatus Dormibacteraeota bacterium]|nr:sulfurtransferase [Candidatus Dormibacteraeota bacterium]